MNNDMNNKKFQILNQFLKDLSFEAPSSPAVFFEKNETAPSIDTKFEIKTINSGENLFEVNLQLQVSSKIAEKTLFLIEISYSAMVSINPQELAADKIVETLIKEVSPYLYPYVREIVSILTKDSGFPPFVMTAIDFNKIEIQKTEEKK